MADLTINSVSAPLAVLGGTTFTINVNVTATKDTFEDGSGYRLDVWVNGSKSNQLLPFEGHLQDPSWPTANFVFPVKVTAGLAPDLYIITAGVIEGPKGLDKDSVPTFGSFGPIIIV
jgi:hypothetical protein